jgi:hypothetical protein
MSWIEYGGDLNHMIVLIQITKEDPKPSSPFKFNHYWLEEDEFVNLVKKEWKHFDVSQRESNII